MDLIEKHSTITTNRDSSSDLAKNSVNMECKYHWN